ncbi:glycerol-3-phosphate 1-O-acyltransferase PlsY [Pseudanabaena sp. PCC 6802]|uniref:glycerol-3-phosphate 1-O-acyltransferase PlsY n=1 Tax=Pseudanabaena sp. PCC 6802 TaxID=118173 RepID=UPI00034DC381|nr:glycerol-3-phosphate 1-O-acyltransferase PlsY [Pseudanabaena sp. PCC 6802]
MLELALLPIAYLLGSIPTGYIAGRLAGMDIREHGSGSTGATNVWRCVGKEAGIAVFAIDLLKGILAVWLMQRAEAISAWLRGILGDGLPFTSAGTAWGQEWFVVAAALLVLFGHSRSCWIGFKGGKSVATGLGVILGINWIAALGAFGLWLATMAIWRTVSISSIIAAIASPILMFVTRSPLAYVLITVVGGLFVIWRHRSNIERILQGREPRFGSPQIEQNSQEPTS